jgi:hypothetical protein
VLPKFSSCQEVAAAFAAGQQARGYGAYDQKTMGGIAPTSAPATGTANS